MKTVFKLKKKDVAFFRKPFGKVFTDVKKAKRHLKGKIVTVGDFSTMALLKIGKIPDIAIIDGKTGRKPVKNVEKELKKSLQKKGKKLIVLNAKNPASSVSRQAWDSVKKAFSFYTSGAAVLIKIKGEEDLLVMPSTYFAPVGTNILYGLPNKGLILVRVNKKKKAKIKKYLYVEENPFVMIGGSWDRFHAGHRYILLTAFEHGKKVGIGVTGEKFFMDKLKKKKQKNGESYKKRVKHIKEFITKFGLKSRAKICDIDVALRRYGPLIVSEETYQGALEVNKNRRKLGKSLLPIIKINRLQAEDDQPISSTRIRQGKIDKNGLPA
ncbi:MAG: pantetheine-phosphate adenylyltransferase [Candidatus Aenigmarchaeota archaeon]|nr:pantetheine-phosphate adenylyltransferase [Candidatus Aenigmarchaeota archaeon]